jgi:6-pyruvoyl tetrahydropterin synthase/QueD family protein
MKQKSGVVMTPLFVCSFVPSSTAMLIYKEFTFDSAHFLPNVPDGHKCKEMHGHTYRLRIWIKGKPDPVLGWVMDFAELKKLVKPVVETLDHKCMNNVLKERKEIKSASWDGGCWPVLAKNCYNVAVDENELFTVHTIS